jgi:hypothetical protein
LAVEIEILREKLSQQDFVHYKPHMTRPGLELELPQWEASD